MTAYSWPSPSPWASRGWASAASWRGLVSAAAGALLNGWLVVRYTGLRPSLFRWVTAPGLAALLAALTSNLLFRWLKDSGVSLLAGGAASLLFGGVLYLAALSAQGVYLSQVFRLRK